MRQSVFLVCLMLVCVSHTAVSREAVIGMSERVFKLINQAQVLMEAEQYDEAIAALARPADGRLTNYETAQILRLKGLAEFQSNAPAAALASFAEALEQPRLPESLRTNLLATYGRIALGAQRFDLAAQSFRQLMTIDGQATPENQALLASALLSQEDFQGALNQLSLAISAHRESNTRLPESWLSMLASVYYSLEEFAEMRTVMSELVNLYPREQYMMNLAALHGQLGDTDRQLALAQAMLDSGNLRTAAHLKMVVNLFLSEELPYKAAELLEQAIALDTLPADIPNLELLSQAWYAAAELEKSFLPLEKAAERSETGNQFLQLASLHMDGYRWQDALDAAQKALQKGQLSKPGQAWLISGMASSYLGRYSEAAGFFTQASNDPDTRAYAQQWLTYNNNEAQLQSAAVGTVNAGRP